MDRIEFTRSIEELPLSENIFHENYSEIMALYNLLVLEYNFNFHKIRANIFNNKLSFFIQCDKENAIFLSNIIQNSNMIIYGDLIYMEYYIQKDGIELFLYRR